MILFLKLFESLCIAPNPKNHSNFKLDEFRIDQKHFAKNWNSGNYKNNQNNWIHTWQGFAQNILPVDSPVILRFEWLAKNSA